jgi:hypothetical protein
MRRTLLVALALCAGGLVATLAVAEDPANRPKPAGTTKAVVPFDSAKQVRTKTAGEIPHVDVKEALGQPCGGPGVAAASDDAAVRQRWEEGPNLVKGDFDQGRDGPAGWDPLTRGVTWVARDGGKADDRMVRFTVSKDAAEGSGVVYCSEYFPVEPSAGYRLRCRWRSSGPAARVLVKCYSSVSDDPQVKPGVGGPCREVYRSQQNLAGPPDAWNEHTGDFTPVHAKYPPRWGRVVLSGYETAGTVDWDDVVVVLVAPARKEEKK